MGFGGASAGSDVEIRREIRRNLHNLWFVNFDGIFVMPAFNYGLWIWTGNVDL